MKNFLSFLMMMILITSAYSQKGWRDHEMEVKVKVGNMNEARMLDSLRLNGDIHAPAGYAILYVIPAKLEQLKKTGLKVEMLKNDLNEYYKDNPITLPSPSGPLSIQPPRTIQTCSTGSRTRITRPMTRPSTIAMEPRAPMP